MTKAPQGTGNHRLEVPSTDTTPHLCALPFFPHSSHEQMPQSHPSPMRHVWSWCWQSTKREMLSLRCLGGLQLVQGAVARDVICPLSKDILRMAVNWVTSLWKQNSSLLPKIATKWWQSCPAHHIPTFRDTFFFTLCWSAFCKRTPEKTDLWL